MAVTINASTSSGLVQSADTSGQIELQTNGTTVATVNTSNNVQFRSAISVGNATPTTSGAGITFPATQSASSDANTLDDYEEGTFTPTLFGGTTAGTTTYSQQEGYYTKIGRQVTLSIQVSATAMTGSGNVRVGNFPFTVGTGAYISPVMVEQYNWSAGTYITGYTAGSETSMRFFAITDDGAWSAQNVVNETQTWFATITYFV